MNETITMTAIIGLVFLGIIGLITYGVQTSNEKYYAAMNQCVSANGTWIPTQNSGACIMKEQK